MNNTSSRHVASRIELDRDRAASIDLAADAAVTCLAGKLWLTQESDSRDHVVPAGTTFCTDRAGRVVVTAVDGGSVLLVRKRAPAHCTRGGVTIDSLDRFTHAARTAQAAYVAELFGKLLDWVSSAVARRAGGRIAHAVRGGVGSSRCSSQ